jgi:hypothetical protein
MDRGRTEAAITFVRLNGYRSRRTPLNFLAVFWPFAGFFTAMYSPLSLLRLVQALAPPSVVLR